MPSRVNQFPPPDYEFLQPFPAGLCPQNSGWKVVFVAARLRLVIYLTDFRAVLFVALSSLLDFELKALGHVFNLGHGIHPAIPPEHAGAMIQAVHELSPPFHTA